jgi:hypothetical protein
MILTEKEKKKRAKGNSVTNQKHQKENQVNDHYNYEI